MGDIQPDTSSFVQTIVNKVNRYVGIKHWKLIKHLDAPKCGNCAISMNHAPQIQLKYNAKLNIHGGKQTYHLNYWKTYAPMVLWFASRLLIIFAIPFMGMKTKDFVMAYTQAQIKTHLHMELPAGSETKCGGRKSNVKSCQRIGMAKNELVGFGMSS